VSLRILLAVLTALAMLSAPLAMPDGRAMAMAPAGTHGQMMDQGHCGAQPAKDDDGKIADKSCCSAMCSAVALPPASAMASVTRAPVADRPSIEPLHRSILAELATPPPRRA
jgi:hypothetical protein